MELTKKEILNNKKTYAEKPYYTVKLQVQACNFELLLNDIPVFSYSVKGGMTNEIPLNSYILKSGRQYLKIKLTPINNQLKLSEQVDLSLDLGHSSIIGENIFGGYIQSGNYKLPQEIKDKQLPYLEMEIPFNAEVPWDYSYILDNAEDLSRVGNLDPFVKKFHKLLEQKNSKEYSEILKNKIKRQSDVKYLSEKEIDVVVKELDLSRIKKLYPLEDYEVKIYANGKLIRFVSKKPDENGNRYLFKFAVPPLMPGGNDGESALNYLFYLPKGKEELEIF
ncbi:MAG TPA: hypothetical protein VF465_21085 [Flavobacterium sp.]|uniref:hypothetical protein n=1 Tax=Flavobacterium sp. TaxID=239 RepID=UPI002ED6A748